MKYIFFFLFCFSSIGFSSVRVSGIFLDIRFEEDKTSPYQIILADLAKRIKTKLDIGVFPVKRAATFFLTDKSSCILPSTIAIVQTHYPKETKDFKMIESDGIEHVTGRIFSRPNEQMVKDFKELEGKTLISWIGIPAKIMIPNINFKELETTSDKQSLAVLFAKRGDFYMGWTPDTAMVALKHGYPIPKFDNGLTFLDTTVKLVCHQTKETERIIEEFNAMLRDYKQSGKLAKLLGPHSVIAK